MGQSERSLRALGRHVAELEDGAAAGRLDRERGRARFLAHLEDAESPEARVSRAAPRAPRRSKMRVVAALAAALVLAAVAVVLVPRHHEPLSFELGATRAGTVGEWIAAPARAGLPIRFSDGSRLELGPGGRARVAAVDDRGAEIALERGALDLSVVHREGTHWLVHVGPFRVRVTGTRFETSWDPIAERFGVALREGAIVVSGPVVGDARAVRAGERLTVSTETGTLEVGSIDAPPAGAVEAQDHATDAPKPEGSAPAPAVSSTEPAPTEAAPTEATPSHIAPAEPPAEVKGPRPPHDGPSKPPTSATPPAEPPAWRALAHAGKYKEALAEAEREGFDAICSSASATDLQALGDAARLGGGSARATQALVALRTRFPGSDEAASAAFLLGRIAQDQSKDEAGAATWLARYLAERPGGAFAHDALGRLLEAKDALGDEAGARGAAAQYLASYPDGPHAAYARAVLARRADAGSP